MSETFADAAAAPSAPPAPRPLRIEFTGSGSEYFRIWIVNLLLILVTLGLYLPFAKARRLSYFYANTVVDGHALGFHGDPWRMFRGFVLVGALAVCYSVAGHFSPIAGLIAFLVLAAIWPALWRSSLRFRLGNSSWRGLRFSFHGDVAGAYKTVAPIYAPVALLLGASLFLGLDANARPDAGSAVIFTVLMGVYMIGLLGLFPLSMAWTKRYQHDGYAYAGERTRLEVSTGRFYVLFLKIVGVMLAAMALMFFAVLLVSMVVGVAVFAGRGAGAGEPPIVLITIGVGLVYLAMFALILPYQVARTQNLVWSGTRSAAVDFSSALSFRKLAGLTFVNWLLTGLTLSLYRPFAAVATARLRLEAMGVAVQGDVDSWVTQAALAEADASGDAAGDFFGIDIGL